MVRLMVVLGGHPELRVAAKYAVCGRCKGAGRHINPSIGHHPIGEDEWGHLGPQFQDDYLSGAFDIQCILCRGVRVVLVPDREAMDAPTRELLDHRERELDADQRERESEAKFGY